MVSNDWEDSIMAEDTADGTHLLPVPQKLHIKAVKLQQRLYDKNCKSSKYFWKISKQLKRQKHQSGSKN